MRRFGLFGRSLSHSFSKSYFENKFQAEGISDSRYDAFELEDVSGVLATAQELQLAGFNITVPYKEEVIPLLDEISAEAKEIGAVNCVKHTSGGKYKGFNTDFYGFWESINPMLDLGSISRALILGSGGAAKAVAYALSANGIVSSTVSRQGALNYENLHPNHIREAQLIVNCTPLGTFPEVETSLDIPYEAITAAHAVFDVVYNPSVSTFLNRCGLAGAKTMNGQQMLELQAERSWEIWNS